VRLTFCALPLIVAGNHCEARGFLPPNMNTLESRIADTHARLDRLERNIKADIARFSPVMARLERSQVHTSSALKWALFSLACALAIVALTLI
jgi:hypothetical protein